MSGSTALLLVKAEQLESLAERIASQKGIMPAEDLLQLAADLRRAGVGLRQELESAILDTSLRGPAAAAQQLQHASRGIKTAMALVHRPGGSERLEYIADRLNDIAVHFRDGGIARGLAVPILGKSAAGSALAAGCSPKKEVALQKARAALASKRELAKVTNGVRARLGIQR